MNDNEMQVREALLEYYTKEICEKIEKYPEVKEVFKSTVNSTTDILLSDEVDKEDFEEFFNELINNPYTRKNLIYEALKNSILMNSESIKCEMKYTSRLLNLIGEEDAAKIIDEAKNHVLENLKLMDNLIKKTTERVESVNGKYDTEVVKKEFFEALKEEFPKPEDYKKYIEETREKQIEFLEKLGNVLEKSKTVEIKVYGKVLKNSKDIIENGKELSNFFLDMIISEIYGEDNG